MAIVRTLLCVASGGVVCKVRPIRLSYASGSDRHGPVEEAATCTRRQADREQVPAVSTISPRFTNVVPPVPANEVRLQLSVLAYTLGNLWRRLVLPTQI